jgi:hypothetical protein
VDCADRKHTHRRVTQVHGPLRLLAALLPLRTAELAKLQERLSPARSAIRDRTQQFCQFCALQPPWNGAPLDAGFPMKIYRGKPAARIINLRVKE